MNGSQKNRETAEGGGNSAEDEGISSSEQDDCEEEVSSSSKKVQKVSPYKMYNNANSNGPADRGGDDTVVDQVLGDFDKMINSASTVSAGSGGDSNKRTPSSCYEYSDPTDVAIVPTRIVPEPPRRSRSLFVNKNFEVNPFFEDDEDESGGADSECAYEDADADADVRAGGGGGKGSRIPQRDGGTLRTVRKQIERFSALAVRDDRGTAAEDGDPCGVGPVEGRRKSLYNVFGGKWIVGEPGDRGRPAVTRSVSTRNANGAARIPAAVVTRFDDRRSDRSVYLPCGDGGNEPRVFVARGHNNAGLYSGFKVTAADPCPIPSAIDGGGSSGLNALQRVNMSVTAGKLTDFPSGLY